MNVDANNNFIAGSRTANDWMTTRDALLASSDSHDWRNAFDEYFRTRLSLRYLHPIKLLQEHGTFTGEGFSIAAIQCSLVEFLESTHQGTNYRHTYDHSSLGQYEYASSSEVFRGFLVERAPFASHFDATIARDFYLSVRCGLLHEARTKNGWRIHAKDPQGRPIDARNKIMFRDDFQAALLTFVDSYGAALESSRELQTAFVRKFDALCE